ncbi:hypothetical protein ABT294_12750 [Nonomuraea sp. NPDC000554]|uniref:hypothetical protein n=1 Tax=Nonomuraea sp. NPDC000554 TaxID=3154259 RepID=UPI0033238DC6
MTIDDVVKETLTNWADEARVPDRLADRALGRRRRNRIKAFAVLAGATAAVVAAALTVPIAIQGRGGETSRVLADGLIADGPAIALTGPPELSTDPDAAVPAKLVATPEVAMYAYYVWNAEKISDKRQIVTRTWYLYNPDTETYEKSPWANVAVAAGGYVAVLEDHQSRRVGILGPHGQVKWVDLEQPASSVEWSPDRKKLLLTSYASNPDEQGVVDEHGGSDVVPVTRTGFSVVDVASGQAYFRPLPSGDDVPERNDLRWSDDGTLMWEHVSTPPLTKRFYDLEGSPQEAPPNVAGTYQEAGLSPSGRSLMIDNPDKSAIVAVKDVASGRTTPLKPVAGHWIEQSVAWSGEDNVITWACALKGVDNCEISEFRSRLLLVGADGRQAVPLTGFMENSQKPGSWKPLFAPR